MPSNDPHQISSIEDLRARMGDAGPMTPKKVTPGLDEAGLAYVRSSPFLLLATADADGNLDVSPKGDGPGFVGIEDERTLLIPDRRGNKLLFGLENILRNPHVGIVFLKPGTEETLRVNGSAELTADPAILERLSARGQPATIAIRVRTQECFFHCAKAFKRARLWEPETWPEPTRISWGAIMAPRLGLGPEMVAKIDAAIEEDANSL